MKIKKVYSSLMALGLVLTLSACGSSTDSTKGGADNKTSSEETNKENENESEDKEAAETPEDFDKQTSDDTIVMGVDSINGDFIQGYANDGNDVKVRRFMGIEGNNGYDCYVQDEEGKFQTNTAALEKDPEVKINEDGSRTTTYTIKKA